MHVQLIKPLTEMIGADKALEINMDEGATVKALIDKIVELYGEKSREVILNDKEKIKIVVVANGKAAELKTKLSDESKVVLMIPYGGG